jgi:predicted nucleotidyltransferase
MRFNTYLLLAIDSKTKLDLLSQLINHPAPMSERELASMIGASHMTTNRIMKELQALNLVDLERIGKSNHWQINKKSYAFLALAQTINQLASLPLPLEHLKKTILKGLPLQLTKAIILFGSVAEKTETATSDIDLFILMENKASKKALLPFLDKLGQTCLTLYGNSLSPYVMTEKELQKKAKLPILNKISKGIRLSPKEKP